MKISLFSPEVRPNNGFVTPVSRKMKRKREKKERNSEEEKTGTCNTRNFISVADFWMTKKRLPTLSL